MHSKYALGLQQFAPEADGDHMRVRIQASARRACVREHLLWCIMRLMRIEAYA